MQYCPPERINQILPMFKNQDDYFTRLDTKLLVGCSITSRTFSAYNSACLYVCPLYNPIRNAPLLKMCIPCILAV